MVLGVGADTCYVLGFPSEVANTLLSALVHTDFTMHTHELHFIRVIACIRRGIDPSNIVTSGHVITRVAGTVVLDGEDLGTDDSRFTIFGSFVIITIIAIWGIRNVVKHEFAAFFAEALFSHG